MTSDVESPLRRDECAPCFALYHFSGSDVPQSTKMIARKTRWPWHSLYFPFSLTLNPVRTESNGNLCREVANFPTHAIVRARPLPENVHNLRAYGVSADRWQPYRGKAIIELAFLQRWSEGRLWIVAPSSLRIKGLKKAWHFDFKRGCDSHGLELSHRVIEWEKDRERWGAWQEADLAIEV